MNEDVLKLQVRHSLIGLKGKVERLCDTLQELSRLTSLSFRLTQADPSQIDTWLKEMEFDTDVDGYYHSLKLLENYRENRLDSKAISTHWHESLKHNSTARAHLYALRDFGQHLLPLHQAHQGIAWIYYQDATNVSIQFPYIHMRDAVEPDFNWHEYHTYQSASPDNNPDRKICWTPPTIDYANEGLITSASIPVYQQDIFQGLWSIDIPLKSLYRSLTHEVMLEGQQSIIVDREGLLIHHPTVHHEIDKKKGSIHRKHLRELSAPFAGLDIQKFEKSSRGAFNIHSEGKDWLVIHESVPRLGWIFIAAFPRHVLVESIRSDLKTAFSKLAQGDTSFRVPDSPVPEYQNIADAYNLLANDLEKANEARNRYQNELNDAKKRLEATLNGMSNFVFFVHNISSVILSNPAAHELEYWINQQLTQKDSHTDLAAYLGKKNLISWEKLQDTIQRALLHHNPEAITCTLHSVDSSRKPREVCFTVTPAISPTGKEKTVVIVGEDVTNEKDLLDERLRSSKLESVGVLAGGIAHDLNNILTAIVANVSLLKMEFSAEKSQELLFDEVESACDRATGLSNQLLTFSKGGKPIKKVTALEPLLRESVSFNLRGSSVKEHFSNLDELSQSNIDTTQFAQVIQNLVINARHAMPAGGSLYVSGEFRTIINSPLTQTLPLPSGEYNVIRIKDEGVGIPERYMNRIFDPYFTTKQSGSGLGLATVFSIVKNHQGHISVESSEKEGTTFTIHLPACVSAEELEDKVKRRQDVSPFKKVLVIDDDDTIRMVLKKTFTHLGAQLDDARNGEIGIKMYRDAMELADPYDLVVLDLTMPGYMGGMEVFSHLRELDVSVTAIVSSGYSNNAVMSDYQKHGFKGVLPKPYTVDAIKEALNTIQNHTE